MKEFYSIFQKLALIILACHNCSDKIELLSLFLLNDNNCYEHAFISYNSDSSTALCQICNENQNYHTHLIPLDELSKLEEEINETLENYQEQHINSFVSLHQVYEEDRFIKTDKSDKLYKQLKLCIICYKEMFEEDMIRINGKMHEVCIICMNEYLKQKILNLMVYQLVCPHCSQPLTPQTIRQYVSNIIYQKFQTFSRNVEIQKNPNLKWCPNPKCSVVISTKKKSPTLKCPKCNTMICSKCSQEIHPGKTCDEFVKSIYKNLQNASDIQKCRNCKSLVQKVAGCNHMTCKICQFQWCWLCGSTYSSFHFSLLNPFGCPGMQGQDSPVFGKTCIYIIRILMLLGLLILSPIVIPCALLIYGPFVIFQFITKKMDQQGFNCGLCSSFFLFVIVCIPFGIALDPIIWIGSLIYFLPQICQEICFWFETRRSMIQYSQNSLRRKFLEEGEEIVVTQ